MQSDRTFVFTVIDRETEGYFRLLRSARFWGWPLKTFFFPVPDSSEVPFYYHNPFIMKKHDYQREALKEAYRKYDYFFFLDGLDTIFTGPPNELVWKTNHFLHFSTETFTWPEPYYESWFPEKRGLNSGVMWGHIGKTLDWLPTGLVPNQLTCQRQWLRDPAGIWLDTHCEVAAELCRHPEPNWLGYKDGRVVCTPYDTKPLVVHANGKWPMPSWIEEKYGK